jgi:glutamate-1-semialdehyde aminotransferase
LLLAVECISGAAAEEAGGVQAGFTSLAHTEEDVDRTIEAAKEVFAEL